MKNDEDYEMIMWAYLVVHIVVALMGLVGIAFLIVFVVGMLLLASLEKSSCWKQSLAAIGQQKLCRMDTLMSHRLICFCGGSERHCLQLGRMQKLRYSDRCKYRLKTATRGLQNSDSKL